MKNIIRPAMLAPIIIGVLVGILLFILGAMDDAPDLALFGIIIGAALMIFGALKLRKFKKD